MGIPSKGEHVVTARGLKGKCDKSRQGVKRQMETARVRYSDLEWVVYDSCRMSVKPHSLNLAEMRLGEGTTEL